MKWIGQHIVGLIARFRSDVYLEKIDTGTIASGAHLGLDSNNKIVKAVDGGGDLTSIVAGTGLSGTSLTGPIPTLNVDAAQTGITSLGTLSSLTVGGNLTVNGDSVTFQSANADDPIVTIKNTSNAVNDMASLKFVKDRGATPGVGDNLAEIYFIGEDADQNSQEYGRILCETDVVTGGQESGVLKFGVANHDGGNGYGLVMTGGSADSEVDVTLGLGSSSVVTIPGDIDLAGDIDVDGTLEADAITLAGTALGDLYSPVAGSSSIVTVGTISTGTWNATAIASAKMATGTASAQGALELATTGEADTGTDTARAVTPAGLKSHVDAYARKSVLRCDSFYINDNPMVQNSLYFGNSIGNQPWNWNDPAAVGGVIGDTASFAIAGDDENWGIVLPFNISKVEVQCSLRPNLGTGDDLTVAIYTGIRTTDADANLTLTKVAHNSVALSSTGNRYTRNDVSVTADYDKNTLIYVGVGSEDNTNMKNGRGYMTITVTER